MPPQQARSSRQKGKANGRHLPDDARQLAIMGGKLLRADIARLCHAAIIIQSMPPGHEKGRRQGQDDGSGNEQKGRPQGAMVEHEADHRRGGQSAQIQA